MTITKSPGELRETIMGLQVMIIFQFALLIALVIFVWFQFGLKDREINHLAKQQEYNAFALKACRSGRGF